ALGAGGRPGDPRRSQGADRCRRRHAHRRRGGVAHLALGHRARPALRGDLAGAARRGDGAGPRTRRPRAPAWEPRAVTAKHHHSQPHPPKHRKEVIRTGAYDIHILGVPPPGLRDAYHALLRMPWWAAFFIIVGSYLLLNVVFAGLFLYTGGVVNARPG